MPVIETKGAGSAQGFGEFAKSAAANYIEDVFSTWLYTGTGAELSINNGINLSANGGMVWQKSRSVSGNNFIFDTARGALQYLASNLTNASANYNESLKTFNTNGFTLGFNLSNSGETDVTWTFRKQPKFFDVQTFTSNASYGATFTHNLGSAPGCVIIKCTASAEYWIVWHRTLGNSLQLQLNTTNAQASSPSWITTSSTSITVTDGYLSYANTSYVAYIFAHNAGGFGLTGTDNVISCGSYTGNTSTNGPIITLGYEPQWLLIKESSAAGNDWQCIDVMRKMTDSTSSALQPNTSTAEGTSTSYAIAPLATGFQLKTTWGGLNATGSTYIYIAIRRGPMKTPTLGTSVFLPTATTAATNTQITTGFAIDLNIVRDRTASATFQAGFAWADRLRGVSSVPVVNSTNYLQSTNTNAEGTVYGMLNNANNTGFAVAADYNGLSQIYYSFQRAPGFFDEVCYTGNASSPRTISHNLGVVPELIIIKKRSAVDTWLTYASGLGNTKYIELQSTAAATTSSLAWNNTSPTSTVFTISTYSNDSGGTYVAYLFATCPGVSKVGSYTGTGATQTISCGFTGGARFVLIKRTDTIGDWYVWDTARGMISGTDPSLLFNSTAAEVNANSIYTATGGFQIVSTAAGINASGGAYIFFAIA